LCREEALQAFGKVYGAKASGNPSLRQGTLIRYAPHTHGIGARFAKRSSLRGRYASTRTSRPGCRCGLVRQCRRRTQLASWQGNPITTPNFPLGVRRQGGQKIVVP